MKLKVLTGLIAAMVIIVAASNYLVQIPLPVHLGPVNLADILTFGAFTYPAAFLVTDLTNRVYGPAKARLVIAAGFAIAVVLSVLLSTPRIAMASGSAFLVAQLLDVFVFDKLRRRIWWQAPLTSSFLGSLLDTAIFFSLAFAPAFSILGPDVDFALGQAPLLAVFADLEAPRWVSWALGDFIVKMAMALIMLIPYGILRHTVIKMAGPFRPAINDA